MPSRCLLLKSEPLRWLAQRAAAAIWATQVSWFFPFIPAGHLVSVINESAIPVMHELAGLCSDRQMSLWFKASIAACRGQFLMSLYQLDRPIDYWCQRRTKIPPLAGVKIHHFARLQVCPQTRLAQCLPQHRSYAGLWSSRIVWEWSGVQGLIALLQPITVTVHLQDMNMMCQPI